MNENEWLKPNELVVPLHIKKRRDRKQCATINCLQMTLNPKYCYACIDRNERID